MAPTIPAILASLRAMLPEHRVFVLQHYGEPEICELLSEMVKDPSVEEQRALLLRQLSGEDIGEVEAQEPKEEERFDNDMVDVGDEGGEVEQPVSDGEDAHDAMSVIQVHQEPSQETEETETFRATPPRDSSPAGSVNISGSPGDSDNDSLASLFEDRHEIPTAYMYSFQSQDVPAAPIPGVTGTHARHSREALKPDPISIRFFVPSSNGSGGTYQSIHHFPLAFQADFRADFKDLYMTPGHPERKPLYEASVRRDRRGIVAKKGNCLNIRIYMHNCNRFTFELSMGVRKRACDSCTRCGRFCARVVLLKGQTEYTLVIYPVNDGARKWLVETDMAFWMQKKE